MANDQRRGAFRAALSHRDYRVVLGGLTISSVGDWIYNVGLIVFVLDQTGSPAWVAAAGIVRFLPYILFGTLGGVVADRYDRRLVMITSDPARAILMLVLAAVAVFSAPVVLALGVVFLSTAAGSAYGPAVNAVTPSLVGERDLAAANALKATVENLTLTIGPALGALLLFLGPPEVSFVLNGASFVAGALLVSRLARTPKALTAEDQEASLAQRLVEGAKAITSSSDAALLVGLAFLLTLRYGQEIVLIPLVSKDLLGTGVEGLGFLLGAAGAGGILAAGVTNRFAASAHAGRILISPMLVAGLPTVLLAFVRWPAVAYVAHARLGDGGDRGRRDNDHAAATAGP